MAFLLNPYTCTYTHQSCTRLISVEPFLPALPFWDSPPKLWLMRSVRPRELSPWRNAGSSLMGGCFVVQKQCSLVSLACCIRIFQGTLVGCTLNYFFVTLCYEGEMVAMKCCGFQLISIECGRWLAVILICSSQSSLIIQYSRELRFWKDIIRFRSGKVVFCHYIRLEFYDNLLSRYTK